MMSSPCYHRELVLKVTLRIPRLWGLEVPKWPTETFIDQTCRLRASKWPLRNFQGQLQVYSRTPASASPSTAWASSRPLWLLKTRPPGRSATCSRSDSLEICGVARQDPGPCGPFPGSSSPSLPSSSELSAPSPRTRRRAGRSRRAPRPRRRWWRCLVWAACTIGTSGATLPGRMLEDGVGVGGVPRG